MMYFAFVNGTTEMLSHDLQMTIFNLELVFKVKTQQLRLMHCSP